jgi:nitroreductase
MELLRGIRTRRSVRAFKDRPIDKPALKKIILAASNAPSYSNTQPWEIAIVAGEKRKKLIEDLRQAVESKMRARPHFPFPKVWPEEMRKRSITHMVRRWEAAGIRQNDREGKRNQFLQNFSFFDAPIVIIIYMDARLGSWSIFDLGLFVQNLILSAYSMGLGTCIQAMPVAYPEIIGKSLGISSSKKIVAVVALGYEDKNAPINRYRSEKKQMEEWVNWFGF